MFMLVRAKRRFQVKSIKYRQGVRYFAELDHSVKSSKNEGMAAFDREIVTLATAEKVRNPPFSSDAARCMEVSYADITDLHSYQPNWRFRP